MNEIKQLTNKLDKLQEDYEREFAITKSKLNKIKEEINETQKQLDLMELEKINKLIKITP